MEGSGDAYDRLMRIIGEGFPVVAQQIREEVQRGRVIQGSKLSRDDRESREERMQQVRVGRIVEADAAPIPYSDDERLALLVASCIRLVESMASARKELAHLVYQSPTEPLVVFEELEGTQPVRLDLSREVETVDEIARGVIDLLAPGLEELGGLPL